MGLKVWNLITDSYDHTQLADNWAKVDQHDHSNGKGFQIPTGGIADGAITNSKIALGATLPPSPNSVSTNEIINGTITSVDINGAAGISQEQLGGGGGSSIISTTESRTNVGYGTLPTPDQVTVTMPVNGLIAVAYMATWQSSVGGAANAAIFLGANQLKTASAASANPIANETAGPGTANVDNLLGSWGGGLFGKNWGATNYLGDVTTGQLVGSNDPTNTAGFYGPCYIFAAGLPTTYTVSIQFKSSSGSVTAKNRKLWVWTLGF